MKYNNNLFNHSLRNVEFTSRGERFHQVVDVRPGLSPHVAEQMRRDMTRGRELVIFVTTLKLTTYVGVKVLVERFDGLIQVLDDLLEIVDLVPRPPVGALVGVTVQTRRLVQ